jgi:hypothetical protein
MHSNTRSILEQRVKFERLRRLSEEQIRAIEANDMERVDGILAAKGVLIQTLSCATLAGSLDPELLSLLDQIKKTEKQAQSMLEAKLSGIGSELREIHGKKIAQGAYFRLSPIGPHGYDFRRDQSLPRFIDREY